MGDLHITVVDRVGEHEERLPGGPGHHEVLHRVVREAHVAPDGVLYHRGTVVGGPKAQGTSGSSPETAITAETVVPGGGVALGPLEHRLAGAVAGIEPTGLPEGIDRAVVELESLRLPVGALVGRHAEPVEGRGDAPRPLLAAALRVGVLDPQDERAAVTAGEEPIEERSPGAPHVEEARW